MEEEGRRFDPRVPKVIDNLQKKLEKKQVLGRKDLARVSALIRLIDSGDAPENCVNVLSQTYLVLRNLGWWNARNKDERRILSILTSYKEQLGIEEQDDSVRGLRSDMLPAMA